jgi:hypothetical protein
METITFQLDIQATNGSWTYDDPTVVAHAPVLVYDSKETDDIGGNENGQPDAGETCEMTVTLRNDGSEEETQITADLISFDPYATITQPGSSYPDIAPGGMGSSLTPYEFKVQQDCPEGHTITMYLQISGWGPYSTEDTFEVVIGQKPILFVDDDGGESYEGYFLVALDSMGAGYDVWTHETQGAPLDSVMEPYRVIVWSTGADFGSSGTPKTLTATDQARLTTYLDSGGKLFLSSQDVLYDNGLNTFVTDYLHVSDFLGEKGIKSVAGVTGDTITDGMAFSLSYPFYNFSDYIMPGAGATGIFSCTGKTSPALRDGGFAQGGGDFFSGSGLIDYCALRYPASGSATYQVVFFSFPFEAIPQAGADPNNAQMVLERILNWFGVKKPSPPSFMHGDANGDQMLDLTDVLFLISYLYKNGYPPTPLDAGDANCDGLVDLTDVLYLISYLYKGGPTPPC